MRAEMQFAPPRYFLEGDTLGYAIGHEARRVPLCCPTRGTGSAWRIDRVASAMRKRQAMICVQ
jgi:hypothetical protein